MRWLITSICIIALAAEAKSAVITGRVLDRAGRNVSHARVRAFHAVPLLEFPPPNAWDGLLCETYSDGRGYFTLRTAGRASLDYLLVHGQGYFSVVFSPLQRTIRVVLSRKILSPDEELRELLKRLRRQTQLGQAANSKNNWSSRGVRACRAPLACDDLKVFFDYQLPAPPDVDAAIRQSFE